MLFPSRDRVIAFLTSDIAKSFLVLVVLFVGLLSIFNQYLTREYSHLESPAILDRNGALLTLQPNAKGAYGRFEKKYPEHVNALVVAKEDRFFYIHPGVNPVSTLRAFTNYAFGFPVGGGSTITQQLAKNILHYERSRTFVHKIIEMVAALALEMFHSKKDILTMYENSIYMGEQVEGLTAASELYFGGPLDSLDDSKLMMLLATISSPSVDNPWGAGNARASRNLALRLGIAFDPALAIVKAEHTYSPPRNFELQAMGITCDSACATTLDNSLETRLREALRKRIDLGYQSGARSGAIVVIKEPENEILAIVGTPNTNGALEGQQINMATEPRAIGSTIKPFIYLKAFEKGLRPYTNVKDSEIKFPIGNGKPFYPKNYDGLYRGWITLHGALSNSLNIPSVKLLQYIGLQPFYTFLQHDLGFNPVHDLDDYQYGIALGALEMDPLTLAHLLTIFPNQGRLSPLQLIRGQSYETPLSRPISGIVADKKYTELVTAVLNDRLSGVQQFGLNSSLNLSQSNYAVKTGTSQNYHDSWTVGFTPDFLVAVWYGNPDNTPLKNVTGQTGAGAVWHDAMEMLMNSPYNKKTPLALEEVSHIRIGNSYDLGLKDDVVDEHQHLLPDNSLISSPLDSDTYLFSPHMTIPLISEENVAWYINDAPIGHGSRLPFSPKSEGDFEIKAVGAKGSQTISIHISP